MTTFMTDVPPTPAGATVPPRFPKATLSVRSGVTDELVRAQSLTPETARASVSDAMVRSMMEGEEIVLRFRGRPTRLTVHQTDDGALRLP